MQRTLVIIDVLMSLVNFVEHRIQISIILNELIVELVLTIPIFLRDIQTCVQVLESSLYIFSTYCEFSFQYFCLIKLVHECKSFIMKTFISNTVDCMFISKLPSCRFTLSNLLKISQHVETRIAHLLACFKAWWIGPSTLTTL